MNTNQRSYQSGQGSKVDHTKEKKAPHSKDNEKSTKEEIKEIEAIDDDFLSGDNKKKTSPNANPNIGGDENEYGNSTSDEERYDEAGISSNTEYQNDPEEENKEYKSPDKGYNFDLFLEF